jgi:hypothetical protein
VCHTLPEGCTIKSQLVVHIYCSSLAGRRDALVQDKEQFYKEAVWVSDSDSDKFSDGEYLEDDIERGNAVMAAVVVVAIFTTFFLSLLLLLLWTLLVVGNYQVLEACCPSACRLQGRMIAHQLCSSVPPWSDIVSTSSSWSGVGGRRRLMDGIQVRLEDIQL